MKNRRRVEKGNTRKWGETKDWSRKKLVKGKRQLFSPYTILRCRNILRFLRNETSWHHQSWLETEKGNDRKGLGESIVLSVSQQWYLTGSTCFCTEPFHLEQKTSGFPEKETLRTGLLIQLTEDLWASLRAKVEKPFEIKRLGNFTHSNIYWVSTSCKAKQHRRLGVSLIGERKYGYRYKEASIMRTV